MKKCSFFLLFLFSYYSILSQTPGTKKWEYLTGSSIESSPAIGADGTIYFGSSDNKLYALNPNGTKKWEFLTGYWVDSSPAVSTDGTIYVGSADNKLYAINPDGTKKWEFLTGDDVLSSPAIGVDGMIYIGSWDKKLYAINPDGTKKWVLLTGDWVDSSPAIGFDGTIYIGSWDKKLYAINPDGTKKWTYLTGGNVKSSPAIGADGTIYFGSDDFKIYAINPDGTKKWDFLTDSTVCSSPAIDLDGTIYVGSYDKKLYAINPDGTKKWEHLTDDDINSTPAIGADGTIYVGADDNKIYAINPNGTKKWDYLTGQDVNSSPAIGADGVIYFGSGDKKLYALNSTSYGLTNSSWPKYRNDDFSRGQFGAISTSNNEFSNIVLPNAVYNFPLNFYHTYNKNITITKISFNEKNFGVSNSLPLTLMTGINQEINFTLNNPQNKWYRPKILIEFTLDGKNQSKELELEGIVFLDDNSELAHTANQAMPVWKTMNKSNEILLNNTKGIFYRLLGEKNKAETSFKTSLSKALNARYAYSGIRMNLGIVKSDKLISDTANLLYTASFKDVQTTASSSSLAPQIYYNQAWEAYQSKNFSNTITLATQTINHAQTNNYLKAKANVLLGLAKYYSGFYDEAKTALNNAISLDPKGPIKKIAEDDLISIKYPNILQHPTDRVICSGGNYTIKTKIMGEPPLKYKWYKNDTLLTSYTNDSIKITGFSPNMSGKYYCIVSNALDSVSTDTIFIDKYQALSNPRITVTGDTIFCQGKSVQLTAPIGFNYLWSTGSTEQIIKANTSGTYLVQLTPNGCSGIQSVPVKVLVNPVPAKPVISVNTSSPYCEGKSISLTSTAGLNYFWSNGSTFQTLTTNAVGNYAVVVSNLHGCKSMPSDTIKVLPAPDKPVITTNVTAPFCEGTSITLNAPVGYTYLWSNGTATQSISTNSTGNYAVIVGNSFGCKSAASDTFKIYPLPAKPVITKSGIKLSTSSTGTFQWYKENSLITGATGQTYTITESGNYSVKVTNQGGCSSISDKINAIKTSIENISDIEGLNIYPNPSSGSFILEFKPNALNKRYTIKIYNVLNQLIYFKELKQTNTQIKENIDIGQNAPGNYYLHLISDNKLTIKTIIIN